MANMNEAYDLSLFQKREPRLVALQDNKKVVENKRRHARRQSVLNLVVYLSLALVALGMIGYFITCNVRLTEMNKQIADYRTQLSTLESEKVRLKSELAGKTSAGQIDRYALENGMQPAENSQIYYIPAEEDDLVQVQESEQNWLRQAWSALRDFFS